MINLVKILIYYFVFFGVSSAIAQDGWKNPIEKKGRLNTPLVETSPFVFNNKLYLLENNQKFWDVTGAKPGDYFQDDEVRIRDLESNKIITIALRNHGFGTALVDNGTLYVFAGNYGNEKPWRNISEITMVSTTDLKSWSKPVTVLKAKPKEYFFNTSVCKARNKYVLLYETNDPSWVPFTFRYMESDDLVHWKEIPGAVYGANKYVGGPALYYEGDTFYTLYLERIKMGYETRITRSKDLKNWEDAPSSMPFLTFDPTNRNIPLLKPDIPENNLSDVELCYYQGKTILFFTGSDQTTAGDLQWGIYHGTPRNLFEHFFRDVQSTGKSAVQKEGWIPAPVAPRLAHEIENASIAGKGELLPTARQLAFQEDQMGAFVHFGPATYVNSDFLTVPDPEIFNPTKLDAEQWVKTAMSFGAKRIVLTAKHHNGFCLWPSKTTGYSVKSSPWKQGEGDVVAEFVAACRKYGISPGLYISGADKSLHVQSTGDPMGKRKVIGDINAYFPLFMEQLRELLTNYGAIDYIWLDGAYDPFGWDVSDSTGKIRLGSGYGNAVRAMVQNLQPQAVVMSGTMPDVRWAGSEQGLAPYPLHNVVTTNDWSDNWVGPENLGWISPEANVHPRNKWFWNPNSDHTLRTVEYLRKMYLDGLGRGANLLVNMTPDTSGLINMAEQARLKEFGDELKNMFGNPIGRVADVMAGEGAVIPLKKKYRVGYLDLEEDLKTGQHVSSYTIEAWIGNDWRKVGTGQTIGRKRIHELSEAIETDRIRVRVVSDRPSIPLRSITVFPAN